MMSTRLRLAFSFKVLILCALSLIAILPLNAEGDWQTELHQWAASSQSNPNCKVRYTTGVYRPDMGSAPRWGLMSEKMFKWLSKEGMKLAPSVCPASSDLTASYRILISVSPMTTVSQTTHGAETRTANEPFNAHINSQTIYSGGGTANTTTAINGDVTTTVVVPTETKISRSSVAEYMYVYRVEGRQLELIGTDSVLFTRVAASGSGENAADAELGAGIGNIIRASKDRHRADRLYKAAIEAIRADAESHTASHEAPAPSAPPPVDDAARAASYERGCNGGDMQSCANLGTVYKWGWGVNKDPSKALALFQRACAGGNSDGCRNATDYRTPALNEQTQVSTPLPPQNSAIASPAQEVGTPKEQSAADSSETQFDIGEMYESGKGVPQDYAQAAIWYRKAAEQGNPSAELNLGFLYANGQGVPQDSAEAYFWFDLAAAGEGGAAFAEIAAQDRDKAASHLSPADLSRAQERARKWFENHPAKPQ